MPLADAPCHLPAASVQAILSPTGKSRRYPPALIDALGRWLSDALERAVARSRATPLTLSDVNRLDRAYSRFRDAVEALQDRKNPPPSIPVRDCQTDWEFWIVTHRALGFKRGRRESVDWHLVGELIAFYEVFSGRRASASQPRGPTARFLEISLGELAKCGPAEMRSYFAPPNAGALRVQLHALRQGYFRFARDDLSDLAETLGAISSSE